jgi:multiple sugar transport system permease protein
MKLRAALLLLLPAILLLGLEFLVPMALVGRLAFHSTDYLTATFVGLRNFKNALVDPYFLKSFANTFWFVLMIAPVSILEGYLIASFLQNFSHRWQSVGRFINYVPSLTSGLIISLLWKWLLAREGLLNSILAWLGLPVVPWLGEPWPARAAVIMVTLSGGVGGLVVLFAAVMKSIPPELHDAAVIDGASEGQYRRLVVWPYMLPTVLLTLLLAIVGTMQTWETIYVLTGEGGPKGATATPVYNIFQTAFIFGQAGYAAAKGVLLMVVIAAVIATKQWVERWAGQQD